MPDNILSISHGYEFDEGLDYDVVLSDVLAIIPVMMRLDADLAEMYDNAGRTQPKPEDRMAWRRFVNHYQYKSRIVRGECGLPGCDGWNPFPYSPAKQESA